jgi:alkanesulfonate monooxygenase SsuD/methylene tetrahydromethanopterin reductase-like flavin-dependent oxidoreductase (luciferase family)
MLKLAGKYADICYIMSQTPDAYDAMKATVLRVAESAKRADKLAFMTGAMGSRSPYDSNAELKKVEAAVDTGASYFLTAFPQTEYLDAMRSFSSEVMPSFT